MAGLRGSQKTRNETMSNVDIVKHIQLAFSQLSWATESSHGLFAEKKLETKEGQEILIAS